jgi:hypothetical protein
VQQETALLALQHAPSVVCIPSKMEPMTDPRVLSHARDSCKTSSPLLLLLMMTLLLKSLLFNNEGRAATEKLTFPFHRKVLPREQEAFL